MAQQVNRKVINHTSAGPTLAQLDVAAAAGADIAGFAAAAAAAAVRQAAYVTALSVLAANTQRAVRHLPACLLTAATCPYAHPRMPDTPSHEPSRRLPAHTVTHTANRVTNCYVTFTL